MTKSKENSSFDFKQIERVDEDQITEEIYVDEGNKVVLAMRGISETPFTMKNGWMGEILKQC